MSCVHSSSSEFPWVEVHTPKKELNNHGKHWKCWKSPSLVRIPDSTAIVQVKTSAWRVVTMVHWQDTGQTFAARPVLKQQHGQRQGQRKQGAPTRWLHRPFWWGRRLLCALLSAVTASNSPHCNSATVTQELSQKTPDTAQDQNQRKKKVSQKTVEACLSFLCLSQPSHRSGD